ncbi:MAG TPA: tetratricopeptide repeat protein [Bacteroidota bacterium]|jgi:tetratricopeptide (TPR) repeat protein
MTYWTAPILLSGLIFAGCGGSGTTAQSSKPSGSFPLKQLPDDDLALRRFIEGSLLDQTGKYAEAILQYQEALQTRQDPAIYHAIAKDYSILDNHTRAIQMGLEAVRLEPDNRTYHETLAEVYVNALDLDGAIREFDAVIKIDSMYLEGWLSLGRLLQVQKPDRALKVYQEVINRFGPESDAYFQMAQIYSGMGKLREATEQLKGMLSLDPGNFEVKKALGDAYLKIDSVSTALRIYNELIELHPENLDVRASIAHAYLTRQDYDAAAEQFEAVLRRDSLSLDDQLKFGQVFLNFIQKDSAVAPYAINLFQRIKKKYPDDWRPYWFLGAIDNITKDDSGAMLNFQKVKELASWNADGWVGIASIYYDKGRFDDAIQVLTEARKVVPEEFRIHFLLGISYQRKHALADAAASLEKAIQLNDKSVDAVSALALTYDELKRPEDSDSMYERGLRMDPHNHLLLNNYAYSLSERGLQLQRSLRMAKEAVEQQPANQSYLDTYGWVYFRLQQYDEAERYIKKAIELGSNSPVINEHLGDIYYKQSKKEKAMEYWQKALQLDATNTELKEKIQRGSL